MPGAYVATRSRPWGSPRFANPAPGCPVTKPPPRDASLPSEAFPPSEAAPSSRVLHANVGSSRFLRGAASPPCCHDVHRCPCLLTLSLASPNPRRRLPDGSCPDQLGRATRPSSANGSVARPAVARRPCPVLPWACPVSPLGPPREREGTRRVRWNVKDRYPTANPRCRGTVPGRETRLSVRTARLGRASAFVSSPDRLTLTSEAERMAR
jgi:hypothetical protein